MGEKEKILAKLTMKDYREDLEFVLENKKFDEEAKSLLLNIYYKLDNYYKDYLVVKQECEEKNKYMEDYVKIIKAKCNKISIVKPQELENVIKYTVDKKKGEIKCIPNETALLHAIFDLIERDISTDRLLLEDFTKICLNNVMYRAKTINAMEPFRDFTGWSWQVSLTDNNNIIDNLIYQNLILLFGYKFINENIYKSNIIGLLNTELNKKKLGKPGYNFFMDVLEICVILYNNVSKENHDKCLKYKKSLISRNRMLSTRKECVEDRTKNSSAVSKQIKSIDDMLNDISLLRECYEKDLKKNKNAYFCLSDFVEKKEYEKQNLLATIKENNRDLKQKQYLYNHEDYEETLKIYAQINEDNETVNLSNNLVKLENDFLECIKMKIENSNTKQELCDLIIKLRYYSNLPIKKGKTVVEQEKIAGEFDNISEILINKMIDNKFIDIGFSNKEFNYKILKYLFSTKIIELSGLVIKITFVTDKHINVEYYDGKQLDYKQSLEIPSDDKITNRKDKKIKIFKVGG